MNHITNKHGFHFIYSLAVQGEGGGTWAMSGRKEVTEVKKRNI